MQTLPDLDVVRAVPDVVEFRDDATDGTIGTLVSLFSVFNVWYEIDSMFEGTFLERTAPGSFKKTIAENAGNVRVLYDHGHDPSIGNKVLGVAETLKETKSGPMGEVPLFDTSYNRDLLPGLKAGAYGSSFRFRVVKDAWDDEPARSESNPKGLPERTIKEVRLYEFGPVTFPANPDATAGVRSLTDRYYDGLRALNPERYEDLVARAQEIRTPSGRTGEGPGDSGGAAPGEPQSVVPPLARDRALRLTGVIK